ncbi:2'-5' RNA ligase [Sphingomonas sp. Leaf339]|uniref:RNA 2',3'-cyclic phosphodiesterase n=1 Tax=Sphingomonas sp. Leaf339 TaxID=1736343 RepID=UPI0006F4E2AE|nr:RNA 2',3'-cyclic phosphodiesterase [Sphingomonas sp. Leaf339]KQU49689.1 2'-5' RNA ligase [Sphingomonas sp. Leaf339]
MIRLFVALRPPPAIRDRLSALMDGVPGARWQDDEQVHLTLRFVGEVDRHQAEDLAAALGHIHAPAPIATLAGVGSFEQRGRADSLWAGVAPAGPLAHLHAKVEQACALAGLPPERRAYRPHITVARLPRSLGGAIEIERWLAAHASLASEPFVLPHLILYRSELARSGAVYEPVARWPLVATAGTGEAAGGSLLRNLERGDE